jgi:hypothetical protein
MLDFESRHEGKGVIHVLATCNRPTQYKRNAGAVGASHLRSRDLVGLGQLE